MSSTAEQPELKGNHAPAEKVGGMRVVRKEKRPSESEKAGSNSQEDVEATEESTSTAVATQSLQKIMQESYPEEAVRHFHEKTPIPVHQQHTTIHTKPQKHELFQPRKQ